MKVIFLDVAAIMKNFYTREIYEEYIFVPDEEILLLKKLVDRTSTKIVLSTTWQRGWDTEPLDADRQYSDIADFQLFEALKQKLSSFGIDLIGHTEDFGFRGEEIALWLSEWNGEPVEAYVIFDEQDWFDHREESQFVIHITKTKKINCEHIEKAMQLLADKRYIYN